MRELLGPRTGRSLVGNGCATKESRDEINQKVVATCHTFVIVVSFLTHRSIKTQSSRMTHSLERTTEDMDESAAGMRRGM